MHPTEYKRMYQLEEDFWWFHGRRAVVYTLLRQHAGLSSPPLRILDLGCGTGKTLQDLRAMGHEVFGLDYNAEALRLTHQRGATGLVRGDAQRLPFADASFDIVVAMDIMEHVADDNAMAGEIRRVLRPRGVALLHVPAHPFLWSNHDQHLHHHRRYTRGAFVAVLKQNGLRRIRLSASLCLLFPAAVAIRLLQKLRRDHHPEGATYPFEKNRPMNSLLAGIVAAEARLLRWIDLPIGLSYVAVVRR